MDAHRSSFGAEHEEDLKQDLLRKYAAMSLALGMARGVLFDVSRSEIKLDEATQADASRCLELTSTSAIAKKLGLSESQMAVNWNDYLTGEETALIKGVLLDNQSDR